ncbi:MAG: Unknown protein [uncultured Sulfurovum sp.]|uniref:Uncharacterized protein n=1 Tax=uncultured Sulfurovum sp. TaxID=269237 RepID=A0A6S6TNF5_9BACT|nr:MAG: Unknown protein [uncultured Sulfurovum sp.]
MSNRDLLIKAYEKAITTVKAEFIIPKNLSVDEKNLIVCQKKYPLKSFNKLYCFSVQYLSQKSREKRER